MDWKQKKILDVPDSLPMDGEFFETIVEGEDMHVERIISHGHRNTKGEWYDQETDEWVLLLQGEATIVFQSGREVDLEAGESLFLPAHLKHRVASTTEDPPCVWLAVHGEFQWAPDTDDSS